MGAHPHPSKEEVRAWLARRGRARLPPPPPDQIRRELGWHLRDDGSGVPPALFVLPVVLAELVALTAVTWCWLAVRPAPPVPPHRLR